MAHDLDERVDVVLGEQLAGTVRVIIGVVLHKLLEIAAADAEALRSLLHRVANGLDQSSAHLLFPCLYGGFGVGIRVFRELRLKRTEASGEQGANKRGLGTGAKFDLNALIPVVQ